MVFTTLFVATLLAGFLGGGIPALLTGLKPGLTSQLGADARRIDRLFRLVHAAWIILMPLTGWMIDGWGAQEVLFCGCLGVAFSLGWLGLGQNLLAALGNLLLLALASAMVIIAAARLMPDALVFSEEYKFPSGEYKFPAGSFGLGYTAVALGYLSFGWLWPRLEARFGFREALLGLGLACLFPAALTALSSATLPEARPHSLFAEWTADPRFWLIGLALFLYFPIEQVLNVWPRPFLQELQHKERTILYLVAGFWLAFSAVRASAGWIMRPEHESWFVLTFLLIASMTLGNLAGAYGRNSSGLGFLLVGACYGPLLPTYLAIAVGITTAPATALGAIYSLAAINTLLVRPWFIRFAQSHTAREAMRIPMWLGLVMAAATLVLTLIPRR